jgi:hypothetical protein
MDALERRQRRSTQLCATIAVAESGIAIGRIATFDRDDIKRDVRNRLAQQGIHD